MNYLSSVYGRIFFLSLLLIFVSCTPREHDTPRAEILISSKAYKFQTGQVKLLDGPFKESQDACAKYLRSLDVDRLIAPFRRESGLKMKKENYSGWENSLPGVALSFYLSGTSRLYAQTGDKQYIEKIEYIIDELKLCQTKNNGYLLGSKDGKKVFEKLEKDGYYEGFSDWSAGHGTPYYVMEKLFSGLIDVYSICHKKEALEIAVDLADWLSGHMDKLSDSDMQKIMTVEYGGMNWVLTDLYGITGNKKYFNMSKRWQDNEVVVPLTGKKDVLSGIHANTQFPKMSGLAARYAYSGDSTDLIGARFFWNRVVGHRTYATGGNSESEEFSKPDSLACTLTQFTEENCNEYNMLKLTSLLNCIEPRAEYADYTERIMWNHLLPAQNSQDGRVCYYLPLMPGACREYQTLYKSFTCCVCSGMDSYTRHPEYIFAHDDSNIYVNQFIASELNWTEKGFSLRQETKFPYDEKVELHVKCTEPIELGIKIRTPYWLTEPLTVKVNGHKIESEIKDGYLRIYRTWKSGDIVDFNLSMGMRVEKMPDDKGKIALFYGPILLTAILDNQFAASLVERNVAPALVPVDLPVKKWLNAENDSLGFLTSVAYPYKLHVEPFFMNEDGCYSVFWQEMDKTDWHKRILEKQKLEQYKKKLELATVDKIVVGDDKNEKQHQLKGESLLSKGNKGIDNNKCWRIATDSIGFGYKLKVKSGEKTRIQMRFMGPAHYDKWDCLIKFNGVVADTLFRGKEASSPANIVLTYSLTNNMINNKDSVNVWFKAKKGWAMPKLTEIRSVSDNFGK